VLSFAEVVFEVVAARDAMKIFLHEFTLRFFTFLELEYPALNSLVRGPLLVVFAFRNQDPSDKESRDDESHKNNRAHYGRRCALDIFNYVPRYPACHHDRQDNENYQAHDQKRSFSRSLGIHVYSFTKSFL
jgi:hypothetical protein